MFHDAEFGLSGRIFGNSSVEVCHGFHGQSEDSVFVFSLEDSWYSSNMMCRSL